jgi:hypothetical protein
MASTAPFVSSHAYAAAITLAHMLVNLTILDNLDK